MDLRDFYQAMGANYETVLSRLLSEERICKYLGQTMEEPSFQLLRRSVEQRDYETAFHAAHTIKGICLNLELKAMLDPVEKLVEDLRRGGSEQTDGLFDGVWRRYQATEAAFRALQEGR